MLLLIKSLTKCFAEMSYPLQNVIRSPVFSLNKALLSFVCSQKKIVNYKVKETGK
jgi:hypothetical protein